ncbi:MAG: 6-phosphofructokinase [Deltaproteobacteria bacterium]|jgi:phosphofructokinase-like protein|nr:6-phosphofructokinase [Deltaproteobacteria bacterium]
MSTLRIGILTGGGDAPGLNAVLRAVTKLGAGRHHWQLVGVEDSFNGLLDDPRRLVDLTPQACRGLLVRGGTILGTTNRGDPFAWAWPDGRVTDRSAELAAAITEEGLDGLIVVGGDGTQRIAARLMATHGVPVIGVPKTIDNDLADTDFTFGFWSAVEVATEALDRLHSTAEAHDRVMLLEVMGRDAGWIALYTGVAGGADCIALPEIPYDVERFVHKIKERARRGRHFTMIVVAEGAVPRGGSLGAGVDGSQTTKVKAGSAAQTLAELLEARISGEVRTTVLGHLQRGGGPVPYDRVLATRFGVKAVELVREGRWGEMVCLRDNNVTSVPLVEVSQAPRRVSPDEPLLATARAVGIELGG